MNTEISSNPYPGLRAFEFEENELFFGREGKAKEIAERLARSHFVAVVGTSGSGKSSLVRAGLLPLLYGGRHEMGAHWRVAIMRPGETPLHNLAASLVYPEDFYAEEKVQPTRDATQIGITEGTLRRSAVGIIDFIKNPANNFSKDENLLVVVDQFEELFRFKEKAVAEDTEEAAAFVKLLIEATRDKQSRIYVVITMRSDFLGDCAEFRDLPEAINEGQYLIPRMTRDQLRQSIESPALVGNGQVSPALVNRLLNDLEDDQNQSTDIRERMLRDRLPVLQHAIMRTWDIWEKQTPRKKSLDIEHYEDEQIGGMALALSKHADEAFAELDKDGKAARQKEIAEKMFKCLTATDSENRETRRPARVAEICAVAQADEREVFEVIEIFRKKGRTFLMPPPTIGLTAETMIDISHESLIRNWESLRIWVRQESEDAWQYRRLAEDALLYEEEYGESEDALWRGRVLADVVKWREDFKPTAAWAERYQILTDAEKAELIKLRKVSSLEEEKKRKELLRNRFAEAMTFLDLSAENEIRESAEKEKVRQLKARERYYKKLIWATVGLVVLVFATAVAAVLAYQQRTEALMQTELAKSREEELKKQYVELQDKQEIIERQNTEMESQRNELQKKNDELKKIQEEIEKNNKELSISIKDTEKAKKVAEEQKGIADEQAGLAKKNERIAKTAEKNARQLADTLADENGILDLNLKGSVSVEAKEYRDAEIMFTRVLEKYKPCSSPENNDCKKQKTIKEWWAYHNIAVANSQLDNFMEADESFEKALEILGIYEELAEKAIIPHQRSQVYFDRVAFNQQASSITDQDIAKCRIITLRKYAQFYRGFATNPLRLENVVHKAEASPNPSLELDAETLNKLAVKMYESLLATGKQIRQTNELKISDMIELADTYFDLDESAKAKNFYSNALDEYIAENTNFLYVIMLRKRLLEIALQQKQFEAAAAQQEEILHLKKAFSTGVSNPRVLLYNKDIANTYAELATIYRKYSLKSFESYKNKIIELRNRNTDPAIKKDLDALENYSLSMFFAEEIDKVRIARPEIWNELSSEFESYKLLDTKSNALSNIANAIKDINAGEDFRAERWVTPYYGLAMAYISNDDCAEAKAVIDDASYASDALYKDDPTKFTDLRIRALERIISFHQTKTRDYVETENLYNTLIRIIEAEHLTKPEEIGHTHALTYLTAGSFYYVRGNYPEARKMFNNYSNYVEANINSKEIAGDLSVKKLLARVLIEQTYSDEKNSQNLKDESEQTIQRIEKLLSEVQEWIRVNQKNLDGSVNANVSVSNKSNKNTANSNVSVATNSNRETLSNDSTYRNTTVSAAALREVSIYEAYLRVRLADLYISKGDVEKSKVFLSDKITIEYNWDNDIPAFTFLIDGYISSLRQIARSQSDNKQAAVYYQLALTLLEAIDEEYMFFYNGSEKYFRDGKATREFRVAYINLLEDFQKINVSDELAQKIKANKAKQDSLASKADSEAADKSKCAKEQ